MLGTSLYDVILTDKAGRPVWQSNDRSLQEVEWTREYCEPSKATATFTAPRHVAEALEPWMHKMSVYRQDGDVLVWHGIVRQVRATRRQLVVTAFDGAVYFGKRRVAQPRKYLNRDASQVARDVIQDALGADDPLEVASTLVAGESWLWQTIEVPVATKMVSDIIGDLADSGLAWTVSAGRMILGPLPAEHTTLQFTDNHWTAEIEVIKEGADCLTDVMVVGKGVRGYFADGDSVVGRLQTVDKQDGAVREDECIAAARRIVEEFKYPPRTISLPSDARLSPSAPVDINELIPGIHIPVSSNQTGIVVGSTLALESVKVKADQSGEQVSVTLMEIPSSSDMSLLPPAVEEDYSSPYDQERRAKEQAETERQAKQTDTGVGPA